MRGPLATRASRLATLAVALALAAGATPVAGTPRPPDPEVARILAALEVLAETIEPPPALERTRRVSGHVRREDGAPLEGALVVACWEPPRRPWPREAIEEPPDALLDEPEGAGEVGAANGACPDLEEPGGEGAPLDALALGWVDGCVRAAACRAFARTDAEGAFGLMVPTRAAVSVEAEARRFYVEPVRLVGARGAAVTRTARGEEVAVVAFIAREGEAGGGDGREEGEGEEEGQVGGAGAGAGAGRGEGGGSAEGEERERERGSECEGEAASLEDAVVLVVETPDGLPARGTRIALFEEVGGGARAGIADAAGERLDDTRALVRLDADMLARARGAAAGSGLRVRVMAEQGFAVARAPRPRARR